jgi:hypothetical protein
VNGQLWAYGYRGIVPSMPDVLIDKDELYPCYTVVTYDYGGAARGTLTEAELADLMRVEVEWNAWQLRLGSMYTHKD